MSALSVPTAFDPTIVGDRRWMLLAEAIEQLSLARSLGDVAAVIRGTARQLSGADGVTFVLREGDLCHYLDVNSILPLWKGQRFPMSACISGWCMLNCQTAIIPDIYADPRIPYNAYQPTFVKSLVMVPVRPEAPLAAIGAYWAEARRPEPQVVTVLEALARSTATALANVALDASLHESESQLHVALPAGKLGRLLPGFRGVSGGRVTRGDGAG